MYLTRSSRSRRAQPPNPDIFHPGRKQEINYFSDTIFCCLRDEVKARFIQFIPIVERDNANAAAARTSVAPHSVSVSGCQYGDFLIAVTVKARARQPLGIRLRRGANQELLPCGGPSGHESRCSSSTRRV